MSLCDTGGRRDLKAMDTWLGWNCQAVIVKLARQRPSARLQGRAVVWGSGCTNIAYSWSFLTNAATECVRGGRSLTVVPDSHVRKPGVKP